MGATSEFAALLAFGPPPLEKEALTKTELRSAGAETHPAPTEAQKETGNYKKGRVKWKGLELVIENPKGSVRSGTSKTGKPWATELKDHYGYIGRTKSKADGDAVDFVMCEDHPDSEVVFVVNQRKEDGSFDEHKVVLGQYTLEAAKKVYLRNYSRGWKGMGEVTPLTVDHFKWWLENGDTSKEIKNGHFAAPENRKRTKQAADDPTGFKSGFDAYSPVLYLVKRAADETDRPFTIAVDLDGTLAEAEEPFDPESIGPPRDKTVAWVRRFHRAGARIIVFTVRGNTELVEQWLTEHDVPYDYVNENPDQPEESSGKVWADVYWDDRAHSAIDPDEHGPEILRSAKAHAAGGDDEDGPPEPAGLTVTIARQTVVTITAPDLLTAMEGDDGERSGKGDEGD